MITNRLPQLLAQKGISIRELAREAGVTYSTIWAMVHSRRRSVQLEVLDAVCEVLEAQPGDIYRRVIPGQARSPAHEDRPAPEPALPGSRRPSSTAGKEARREWRSW